MNSKFSPTGSMYQKYGPRLEAFLEKYDHPEYVRPKTILTIEPTLFEGCALSRKGQERVLGVCISAYRSPAGERYVKYNTRQWRLTPPQDATDTGVTA